MVGIDAFNVLWAAFLSLFGASSNVGDCYAYDYPSGPVVECSYAKVPDPELADRLTTATGLYLMAGPWAEDADIRFPAIESLVGDRPVMMNVGLRGYGVILRHTGTGGLMENVVIDLTPPDAGATFIARRETAAAAFPQSSSSPK